MMNREVFTIKNFEKEITTFVDNRNEDIIKILRITYDEAEKHLEKLNQEEINYVILQLNNKKSFFEQINKIKSIKRIIVPEIKSNQVKQLLKEIEQIKGIKTLIIDFKDDKKIDQDFLSELYAERIYPLLKNVPLCRIPLENSYEIFFNEVKQIKKIEKTCETCLVKNYCAYSNKKVSSKKAFLEKNNVALKKYLETEK